MSNFELPADVWVVDWGIRRATAVDRLGDGWLRVAFDDKPADFPRMMFQPTDVWRTCDPIPEHILPHLSEEQLERIAALEAA